MGNTVSMRIPKTLRQRWTYMCFGENGEGRGSEILKVRIGDLQVIEEELSIQGQATQKQ